MPTRAKTKTKAKAKTKTARKKAATAAKSPKTTRKAATKKATSRKAAARKTAARAEQKRESGVPGGGAGRREEIERTPVYPVSEMEEAPGEARIHGQKSWGQGERGAEGYDDVGKSELPTAEGEVPRRTEPPGETKRERERPEPEHAEER